MALREMTMMIMKKAKLTNHIKPVQFLSPFNFRVYIRNKYLFTCYNNKIRQ